MVYLVTAGPTREAIDPVRYLSNYSSGKMGYAIAEAAVQAGHRVILISGPTAIELPEGVDYVAVESAQDMMTAVMKWVEDCDVAVFTAAVADYRPKEVASQKMKKSIDNEGITLELVKNPDVLAEVSKMEGFKGVSVGFAAETEDVLENARAKLLRKGCDLILANDVSGTEEGFGSDYNTITALSAEAEEALGSHTKQHLGNLIVKLCDQKYRNKFAK